MIRRLPDTLINQIAAGEVVERPASAVKELVENALDAGATQIDVYLRDGGLGEIRVVDDGVGMHPEDLLACTERHATSKITDFADLERLESYGFRGEALSSIASVSDFEIQSRPRDQETAFRTALEFGVPRGGGARLELERAGGPVGTQVRVRRLFERVPARAKYLKSSTSEFAACAKQFKELVLANPAVTFSLHHQDQSVGHFPASEPVDRFDAVVRPKWKPLVVRAEHDAFALEAFLSPGHWIADKGTVQFFLNRRPVRNRAFTQAVRLAYEQALGPHHEPSGAVYLDIRPDWIDPNVHPQKLEVRCLHSDALFTWLVQTLRKQLAEDAIPREIESRPWQAPLVAESAVAYAAAAMPKRPAGYASFEARAGYSAGSTAARYAPPPTRTPIAPADSPGSSPFSEAPELVGRATAPVAVPLPLDVPTPEFAPAGQSTAPVRGLRFLAQLRASYLLAEDEAGLVIVDQHALHERLRFERLRAEWEAKTIASQRSLVPPLVTVDEDHWHVLEERELIFQELGFEFSRVGRRDVAVAAAPASLDESVALALFARLVDLIADDAPGALARDAFWKTVERAMATAACHSAVRANHALDADEAEALLAGLASGETGALAGWTCPHGRPVLFRLSFQEIEKHFERT